MAFLLSKLINPSLKGALNGVTLKPIKVRNEGQSKELKTDNDVDCDG